MNKDILSKNFIVNLTSKEIQHLFHLASQIDISPSTHPDDFCKKVNHVSYQLSFELRGKLVSFAKKGNEHGFLVIRGLFLNPREIPPTPPDNREKKGETTALAKIQAILLSVLGEMIAYEAEGYGRLFQDVVPNYQMATYQTSLGSNVELEIHTEQAFSSLRPDFLSLACLRGDENAFTYLLPVQKIIENITDEERELLFQKKWYTGVDFSFKLQGKEFMEGDLRGPMAILQGDNIQDPHLVFDQDLMRGTDEESQQMISRMVDLYYQHRISYCLQPGEILFIDNRKAVHGRSPFFPKYDGKDRFLIRCFATTDYKKSEYARSSSRGRMVSAIYS